MAATADSFLRNTVRRLLRSSYAAVSSACHPKKVASFTDRFCNLANSVISAVSSLRLLPGSIISDSWSLQRRVRIELSKSDHSLHILTVMYDSVAGIGILRTLFIVPDLERAWSLP